MSEISRTDDTKAAMLRYAPRLIPAGSAPEGALVEPLIADPPTSPLGEHELIPQVAWMVERDGTFVHVADSERVEPEIMRGSAELTKLDGELSNEALDHLPGINAATNGEYAAELFLDRDHLAAVHQILGFKVYLAGAPRRGRFLIGGVGAGIDGMDRISPVTLLVRDAAPMAVVGELQLAALAQAAGGLS
jgi:hypothetical protein